MGTLDQRVAKLESAMSGPITDYRTIIVRRKIVEADGTISELRTATYEYDEDYSLLSHTETIA